MTVSVWCHPPIRNKYKQFHRLLRKVLQQQGLQKKTLLHSKYKNIVYANIWCFQYCGGIHLGFTLKNLDIIKYYLFFKIFSNICIKTFSMLIMFCYYNTLICYILPILILFCYYSTLILYFAHKIDLFS